MIKICLFDTPVSRLGFYPLSLTRPICDLRLGILTIREWWEKKIGMQVNAITEDYLLQEIPAADFFILVDATVIPDDETIRQILALKKSEALEDEQGLIAYWSESARYNELPVWPGRTIRVADQFRINHVTDLFKQNAKFITDQFQFLFTGKASAAIHASNLVINEADILIEEGVGAIACIINANEGPVYIGKNANIMEGALIHGPVAICEGATIKMGAKIYPGTTIGPYSIAGGEIKNALLMGYSNKGHDGYLGDTVLGEWCNLGAGTSNSNVKNTGGDVSMWHEENKSFRKVGPKAGLIMGDYSRSAINTSFNTGTTIGVSCNVFDGNYPPKHVPSFSWGLYDQYDFEKACRDASNWKKMKGKEFTQQDRLILQHLYQRNR